MPSHVLLDTKLDGLSLVRRGKVRDELNIGQLCREAYGGDRGLPGFGTDRGTADAIRSMGAKHKDVGETDVCIDEASRVVSTPCYMNDVGPWVVYQGAEKMVEEVLRMAGAH